MRQAIEHHRAGQRAEAEGLYRQILALDPGQLDAMQLLGVLANDAGRHDEAIRLISTAISKAPNIASWHSNLGSALRSAGRYDDAVVSLRRAVELAPDLAAARFNLAGVLGQVGKLDEAIVEYGRAAELAPNDPNIQRAFAEALYENGDTAGAINRIERAIQLFPAMHLEKTRARLFDATLLPLIYDSMAEMQGFRQRVSTKVRELVAEGVKYPLIDKPAQTMFRLAYQGMNDREILHDYASLMAPPELPTPKREPQARIRVGFISAYFRNHTVGRLTINLVEKMNRGQFEISVLSIGNHRGAIADRFRNACERFVVLPNDLPAARRIVADQNLDVLFYADLGMDQLTYAMAFSRLAPLQCVTWGQSVSSGVPAIDCYISSTLLEDETAQANYTERLVRLPSLCICYDKPQLGTSPKRREDFGLPEGANLYGCLQTLFKFHPEFDAIIAEVLRRDPRGILVMVSGHVGRWPELLATRFKRTMPDVVDRIRWLPRLGGEDFFALTALCDVMLDPIYFGGCTTSSEALAFGVPIVTLPSQLLPSRFTQAFYRMMQMDECVVSTPRQYVDLAVEIGTNPGYRHELSHTILSRNTNLFDNTTGVRELEAFFRREMGRG